MNFSSPNNSSFREAGIVEKLLNSYGFIQCCERQARLFFHYSQFTGTIQHLKLGDPVEFEMTYDRRTGKPIASRVVKIRSEAPIDDGSGFVDNSTERMACGFITTEPVGSKDGRVAYENEGEFFFLPFTLEDVEPGTRLQPNDKVTFRICTDKSGNLRARKLALLQSTPNQYQGIICTKKDTFGFIERADVVREIFFHATECDDFKSLNVGDEVAFQIQTRNDKQVAVNLQILPKGSVVFEDVSSERVTGFITRMPDKFISNGIGRSQYSSTASAITSSHLNSSNNISITPAMESGLIKYNQEDEICFALKDINGEFTLRVGDLVTFYFVTDRRDGMRHAGKIELHENCFNITNEPREQGYIASLKDAYGFIKCFNREGTKVYFKLSEVLDTSHPININDEVEFTITQDISSPSKLQASRIRFLPNGTILKNLISRSDNTSNNCVIPVTASVPTTTTQLATGFDYPLIDLGTDDSCNLAASNASGVKRSNEFVALTQGNAIRSDTWSDILSTIPIQITSTNPENSNFANGYSTPSVLTHTDLMSVELDARSNDLLPPIRFKPTMTRDDSGDFAPRNGAKSLGKGFIAALKDSFGFIENDDHQTEIFFHYSVFEGNPSELELGREVEYSYSIKNNKLSAEWVRSLPKGSIPIEETLPGEFTGTVIRPCRCSNPEQEFYSGLIQITPPAPDPDLEPSGQGGDECSNNNEEDDKKLDDETKIVEFSMKSLCDIHEFVQKGDTVTFQIALCKITHKERAVQVKPIRDVLKARVEAVRNNYGFLDYEVEDGKKLFFHMSEFKGNNLRPGDYVEFAIVYNQRSNKYSACNIIKCQTKTPRPEHLIVKLKAPSGANNAKVILIRQPRGPDGTKGFNETKQQPQQPQQQVTTSD